MSSKHETEIKLTTIQEHGKQYKKTQGTTLTSRKFASRNWIFIEDAATSLWAAVCVEEKDKWE